MFDSATPSADFEQPTPQPPGNDDTPTTTAPAGIAVVTECHSCGYETELPGPPPPRCPKCGASAWARFARLTGNPQPPHPPDHRGGARGPRRQPRRATFDRPTHHIFRQRGHAVA
jgi:hypothetical protein